MMKRQYAMPAIAVFWALPMQAKHLELKGKVNFIIYIAVREATTSIYA